MSVLWTVRVAFARCFALPTTYAEGDYVGLPAQGLAGVRSLVRSWS